MICLSNTILPEANYLVASSNTSQCVQLFIETNKGQIEWLWCLIWQRVAHRRVLLHRDVHHKNSYDYGSTLQIIIMWQQRGIAHVTWGNGFVFLCSVFLISNTNWEKCYSLQQQRGEEIVLAKFKETQVSKEYLTWVPVPLRNIMHIKIPHMEWEMNLIDGRVRNSLINKR